MTEALKIVERENEIRCIYNVDDVVHFSSGNYLAILGALFTIWHELELIGTHVAPICC